MREMGLCMVRVIVPENVSLFQQQPREMLPKLNNESKFLDFLRYPPVMHPAYQEVAYFSSRFSRTTISPFVSS